MATTNGMMCEFVESRIMPPTENRATSPLKESHTPPVTFARDQVTIPFIPLTPRGQIRVVGTIWPLRFWQLGWRVSVNRDWVFKWDLDSDFIQPRPNVFEAVSRFE
jgi:hypothetical protein